MNKLRKFFVALGATAGLALCVAGAQGKILREYRGVHLDMKQAEVHAKLGSPANGSESVDEFKLTGDDLMTVRYENGVVNAIQLMFLDAKNAPPFSEVIGDAKIEESESGRKTARKVMEAEKFWVSMSQSKDASMTTVTIKRM
jgi:hypothetical protein